MIRSPLQRFEEITDMRTYLLPTGEQVDPNPDNAVFVASMTYLVHTDSVIDPKAPPQASETSAEDHLSDAYAKAFNAMMPFGIMMIGFVLIIGVVKIFTRPY